MNSDIKGLIVQELSGGVWVNLITLPFDESVELTKEKVKKAIESVHNLLYRGSKVELSTENVSISIRGLQDSRVTLRVITTDTVEEEEYSVGIGG